VFWSYPIELSLPYGIGVGFFISIGLSWSIVGDKFDRFLSFTLGSTYKCYNKHSTKSRSTKKFSSNSYATRGSGFVLDGWLLGF
jgi:hypothetical protein